MSGNESGGICKSGEAGGHKLLLFFFFFTKTSSLFYFAASTSPCIIPNLGSRPEHRQHCHSVKMGRGVLGRTDIEYH